MGMTNEETIKRLKEARTTIQPFRYVDEAIDYAIQALEQQPCEDCISRAEAISRIEVRRKITCKSDPYSYEEWTKGYEEGIDDAIAMINSIPSVTLQPRVGQWILTDVEGNRVWHCSCSECGKDPQDYIGGSENWWLIKNKLPKYCPNCGSYNGGDGNV